MNARTISVVATSVDATKAALAAAKPIAAKAGLPVVLLIPRNAFGRDTNWLVAGYEEAARDVGQPVQVRVGLSPSALAAVTTLTPSGGTVVIGGPERWWWPTAEERLAAKLRRAGRDVVFVGCNRG